jgi:hypothetical protein
MNLQDLASATTRRYFVALGIGHQYQEIYHYISEPIM